MGGDGRIDQVAPQAAQPRQGAILVRAASRLYPTTSATRMAGDFSGLAYVALRRHGGWRNAAPARYASIQATEATEKPLAEGPPGWKCAMRAGENQDIWNNRKRPQNIAKARFSTLLSRAI